MSFIWPVMFILLLLIPLCVVLYIRMQRRRQRLAASYASFGLGQPATGRQPGARRHIPIAVFLIGLAMLIVALARPQMVVSLPRIEGTAPANVEIVMNSRLSQISSLSLILSAPYGIMRQRLRPTMSSFRWHMVGVTEARDSDQKQKDSQGELPL